MRRGYFIEGLEGTQYAWPGAIDRLREPVRGQAPRVHVVAAVDPANAWGSALPWPQLADPFQRVAEMAVRGMRLAAQRIHHPEIESGEQQSHLIGDMVEVGRITDRAATGIEPEAGAGGVVRCVARGSQRQAARAALGHADAELRVRDAADAGQALDDLELERASDAALGIVEQVGRPQRLREGRCHSGERDDDPGQAAKETQPPPPSQARARPPSRMLRQRGATSQAQGRSLSPPCRRTSDEPVLTRDAPPHPALAASATRRRDCTRWAS